MSDLHDIQFPDESNQYRSARNQLLQKELELRNNIEELAALRRNLPLGGEVKEDYLFEEIDTLSGSEDIKQVKLSELFDAGKESLIIYSFMYGSQMESACTSCTSILDSMDGASPHVNQRVNMAVVAKSPIRRIVEFAQSRGWNNLRLLSSEKNTYNKDYFGEGPDGGQWPACNVFVKKDKQIFHTYSTELLFVTGEMQPRHVDLMWPLWNFFDLTPEGRGTDWYPKLEYSSS